LIVIGGGGLFMDYFVPFWQGFRPIARRVPFCIWGVGYCDLKREPSRPPLSILKEVIPLSRLCIVRDDLSRRHLADFDLPAAVPCPSMCAISFSAGSGHGLLHVDSR
jgi:polysaccharide pyruvyl transferase WcaK-like protein